MLFQLASGKTIYLTIEQFLDLTDNDIQYLNSVNAGESITNPFHGSSLGDKSKKHYIQEEEPLEKEDDPLNSEDEEDQEGADETDHDEIIPEDNTAEAPDSE